MKKLLLLSFFFTMGIISFMMVSCSKNEAISEDVEQFQNTTVTNKDFTAGDRAVNCCTYKLSDFTHANTPQVFGFITFRSCTNNVCGQSVGKQLSPLLASGGSFSVCKGGTILLTIQNNSSTTQTGNVKFLSSVVPNGGSGILNVPYTIAANSQFILPITTTNECTFSQSAPDGPPIGQ